jgi:serine/threonine-protein kinase
MDPAAAAATLRPQDVAHDTQAIVGRGGSGIVHRGTITHADGRAEPVAIKRLQAGATPGEERRFQKEFAVSLRASQRCPRACRLYGCVAHEGALCLVMKLYAKSLHAHLDERRSPDGTTVVRPLAHGQVAAFAAQILEGLAQLHAVGIVAQDLKPSNLLMDERGQLFIADFGLASVLATTAAATAQSTTGAGGGTPAYKAPEQYDEESFGKLSPKTDMWAFGCVVVEMLTGFAPWRGKQPMQIMMSVAGKRQAPAVPGEARGALAEILRRCLSIDQGARPTAEQALASLGPDLAPAEEGVPGAAAAASFGEPEPEPQSAVDMTRDLWKAQVEHHRAKIEATRAAEEAQVASANAKAAAQASAQAAAAAAAAGTTPVPASAPAPRPAKAKPAQGCCSGRPKPELGTGPHAPSPPPQPPLDALGAEMAKHGLTAQEQALLRGEAGGVTSVALFNLLQEEDFRSKGIDIAARRKAQKAADAADAAAKKAADAADAAATAAAIAASKAQTAADAAAAGNAAEVDADARGLRVFLQSEGTQISAAGQQTIILKVKAVTKLCDLDLAGAQAVGLNVVDARLLTNLLGSSPTIAGIRLRLVLLPVRYPFISLHFLFF